MTEQINSFKFWGILTEKFVRLKLIIKIENLKNENYKHSRQKDKKYKTDQYLL